VIRSLIWGVVAVFAGIALFVGQALVGLNFHDEGENVWWLELLMWAGRVLAIVGALVVVGALAGALAGLVRTKARA
jgi:hypothetical protein